MYSQVLKCELNISFYRSYVCLINIFNSYIFNSFFKRDLFLRVFIFIQLSLRILFKLKTKSFLRYFLLCGIYISRKKKIKCKILFL